jgi:hypothetical protein
VSLRERHGSNHRRVPHGALDPYKAHSNGTPEYDDNPTTASEPGMQLMIPIDRTTHNGFEQIYVPSASGGWLPATNVRFTT